MHTWETLNLMTKADSSTDTKMDRNGQKAPVLVFFLLEKQKLAEEVT